MAYQNPWALRGGIRPPRPVSTKTFSDPELPGVEFALTLQALDAAGLMRAAALTQDYCQRYMGNPPAEPLAIPDGEEVQLSEALFRQIALLECMQVAPEKEKIPFMDWVGWTVMSPAIWWQVIAFRQGLQEGDGDRLGNSPREPTPGSSEAPSAMAAGTPS